MSGAAYESAERTREAALGRRATVVQRLWRGCKARREVSGSESRSDELKNPRSRDIDVNHTISTFSTPDTSIRKVFAVQLQCHF